MTFYKAKRAEFEVWCRHELSKYTKLLRANPLTRQSHSSFESLAHCSWELIPSETVSHGGSLVVGYHGSVNMERHALCLGKVVPPSKLPALLESKRPIDDLIQIDSRRTHLLLLYFCEMDPSNAVSQEWSSQMPLRSSQSLCGEFLGVRMAQKCIVYAPYGRIYSEYLNLGDTTATEFAAAGQDILRNMSTSLLYAIMFCKNTKLVIDRANIKFTAIVENEEAPNVWLIDIQFVVMEVNDEKASVSVHGNLLHQQMPPEQLFQRAVKVVAACYRNSKSKAIPDTSTSTTEAVASTDDAVRPITKDMAKLNMSFPQQPTMTMHSDENEG